MLLFVLAALQSPHFTLDGVPTAAPSALLNPVGLLEVSGEVAGGERMVCKLRFLPLEWPAPGTHDPAGEQVRAFLVPARRDPKAKSQDDPPLRGKLEVAAFDHQRVRFTLRYQQGEQERVADVDLPVTLHTPAATPRVTAEFKPPDDQPDRDDVVFCAFGNGGTGLPGQRLVAESIAKLAATGPLDFVLLLGNNIGSRGVTSAQDPLFKTCFEDVYDKQRMPVPFFVMQGPADYRGAFYAAAEYGTVNARWTSRPTGFGVDFTCRGKTLTIVGGDSPLLAGSIADSRTRTSLRGVFEALRASKADWKIVCAYDQLIGLGGSNEGPNLATLESRAKENLTRAGVDLLLSANALGMRLVVPEQGIPQVLSGGGGGPEMVGIEPEVVPGTRFCCAGGGFTWFRFDGTTLQISFRDALGKVLYVHELKKP
jgi:tartrate-resistant acid phosphatase type 5